MGVVIMSFGRATAIFAGANALGLGISIATGSHLHLDLIGTGAFSVVAVATRGTSLRQQVSAGCMGIWATRLAGFLFYRALEVGHDARLDDTLSTHEGATGFWTISFMWGVVCSLPHTLTLGLQKPALKTPMGLMGFCGVALFAAGLGIETMSDLQKYSFKKDPLNKGKFCDTGLWMSSQHPNYFGNLCLWGGILLLNAPVLRQSPSRFGLAFLSPLFMTALFYGQASGAIANTVQLAEAKYGADPNYRAYVDKVPLIVPYKGLGPYDQEASGEL